GTLEVESTGGTDQWQTIETKLDRVTGVQTIFFVFQGEGKDLFEIDYWIFTERDDDPPGDDDDPPGGGDDDPPGEDDDPPGGGDDDPPGEDDDPPGGGTSPPPYYGPITPVVQIGIDGNQVPAGTLETFVVNGWKTTTLNV